MSIECPNGIACPDSAIVTTRSGRHINLLLPSPADILIDDIGCSLSELRRFTGHTVRPYTVAEHCLLGLDYIQLALRLEYLMHDASEAYLNDVSGPLKVVHGMQFYRDLEAVWTGAIADRFGLPRQMSKEVHVVDKRMLVTERRDLMGRMSLSTDKYREYPMHIGVVTPPGELLKERFISAFYSLVSKTEGAKR